MPVKKSRKHKLQAKASKRARHPSAPAAPKSSAAANHAEPQGSRIAADLFEKPVEPTEHNAVDRCVMPRLKELGIRPARPCSDAAFVRRVYLDVIGTLPTAEEVVAFLMAKKPNKRAALIDQLLDRPEYADYWAMRWSDLLRVKSEFPINLWPNAAQAYYRWIHTALKQNMPYDRFVRALLTSSGSNFRVPPVNFYRAMQDREPDGIARTVALTFMGARADQWKKDRLAGMAGFFKWLAYKGTHEWKEQVLCFDAVKAAEAAASGKPIQAVFPDGKTVRLSPQTDPREVFADWLIRPDNPWFAANIVNRLWFWLLGRGIVHEPDDFRPSNPPVNPPLLAALGRALIDSHYDLKQVLRLILNSQTYQLSCLRRSDSPQAPANFAFYPIRRLDAEVLIDALCQITGTTETYSSLIPEPFTFIPPDQRSIALPDGSITSAFLDMFGRPPRDTGLADERNNRPSADQRLHLLNSSHIRNKIDKSPRLRAKLTKAKYRPEPIIQWLYLTIVSRFPTDEEKRIMTEYAKTAKSRGSRVYADLAWALVNSAEFLYRH